MSKGHIAFIVESAHGHVNPTLGITEILVAKGYRVTYPIKEYFASRVVDAGAEALIYRPLENKLKIFRSIQTNWVEVIGALEENRSLCLEETRDTLFQLESLYGADRPDLVIYDEGPYLAGRQFAEKSAIRGIRYCPGIVEFAAMEVDNGLHTRNRDDITLVFSPRCFCRNPEVGDGHFYFVGPIYSKMRFFTPWRFVETADRTILASATTGLLSQVEFFKMLVQAFEGTTFHVILSIGDQLDEGQIGSLPANFEFNRRSSQLEILERASLFIGHGGMGSTIEALSRGVPVVLIPPSSIHQGIAGRVVELGAGVCIDNTEASPQRLRDAAEQVLSDETILKRADELGTQMRQDDGAVRAAALIEEIFHGCGG